MRLTRLRLSSALLAAGVLLAAPWGAQAQSLKELYDAARAYDATWLAAKALAESAQYKAEQAEALGRPSAALVVNGAGNYVDPPKFANGTSNSLGAAVNGALSLYNPANSASIEQARRALASAQADLDTAEQDLAVRVAAAYFDVLAAQDALATQKQNKALITEQLASAKRNFEVGTATITDTREAQARFDLATAQEIQAENDLRTKRIALDQLVGRSNVEPKPLLIPVALPSPMPASAEEWVSVADQQHPSVRRARVGVDVAALETEKARAGGRPTLDATASVGNSYAGGSLLSVSPGNTATASVGLRFNWPLYTGGAVQNRIKETLLLEEQARNNLEAARRGVAQGTRVAFFGVQSGLAQVKALEAAESSSKLALEATQLGYKVGVRVNLDVLNAQTQLFQTQRDLARARYDVLVGHLKLRQASGQLSAADLDVLNALLAR